jgi:hypothetical protein
MSTTLTRPRARRRVAVPGSQTGWIVAAIVAAIAAVTTGVVMGTDDAPPAAPSTTGLDEDAALRDLQIRGLVPTGTAAATGAVDADIAMLKEAGRSPTAAVATTGAVDADITLLKEAGRSKAAPAVAETGGDRWLASQAEELRRQRVLAAWSDRMQEQADLQQRQPTVIAGDLWLLQKAAEIEAM